VATLSPFTLLKLVPAVEAGAVAHLESTRHRLGAAARPAFNAGNLALDVARDTQTPDSGGTAEDDVGSRAVVLWAVTGAELSPVTGPHFATDAGGDTAAGHHHGADTDGAHGDDDLGATTRDESHGAGGGARAPSGMGWRVGDEGRRGDDADGGRHA
jgi:hypothetical protein